MTSAVHAVAQAGFGQGTNELYDKARPSYPHDAIFAIRTAIKGTAPYEIVELGAGTGIFTRALLLHPDFSDSVGHIQAIEPSQGMRDTFAQKIQNPSVSVKEGAFEETGLDDACADLVIVAQAWHWCPNYDLGMKEIARILRPNGVAFFIWNMEDRDAAEWVKDVRDAYEKYELGTPQFRLNLWRATFTTQSYMTFFEPQKELWWKHAIPTTEQGVIDRVYSKSYITQMSESARTDLGTKIRQLVSQDLDKVWSDKDNGIFEYPYKTLLVIMNRKSTT